MLTGEVKKRLTEVLTEMVERHHMARAAVTDEVNTSILIETGQSGFVLVCSNERNIIIIIIIIIIRWWMRLWPSDLFQACSSNSIKPLFGCSAATSHQRLNYS